MAKAFQLGNEPGRLANRHELDAVLFVAGIMAAPVVPLLATAIYALVAIIWQVPDKRIDGSLHPGRGLWTSSIEH